MQTLTENVLDVLERVNDASGIWDHVAGVKTPTELVVTETRYLGTPHDLLLNGGEFVRVRGDDPLVEMPYVVPLQTWMRAQFMRGVGVWRSPLDIAYAWEWKHDSRFGWKPVPPRERLARLTPLIGTKDHRLVNGRHLFRRIAVANLAMRHFVEWSRPYVHDLILREALMGMGPTVERDRAYSLAYKKGLH